MEMSEECVKALDTTYMQCNMEDEFFGQPYKWTDTCTQVEMIAWQWMEGCMNDWDCDPEMEEWNDYEGSDSEEEEDVKDKQAMKVLKKNLTRRAIESPVSF